MIVSVSEEGRYAPVLICDICEQRITDAGLAGVVSRTDQAGGVELNEVLYAHKGRCLDAAEEKLGGYRVTGWRELSDHLIDLLYNCGLTVEKLVELKKLSDKNSF